MSERSFDLPSERAVYQGSAELSEGQMDALINLTKLTLNAACPQPRLEEDKQAFPDRNRRIIYSARAARTVLNGFGDEVKVDVIEQGSAIKRRANLFLPFQYEPWNYVYEVVCSRELSEQLTSLRRKVDFHFSQGGGISAGGDPGLFVEVGLDKHKPSDALATLLTQVSTNLPTEHA